MIRSARTRPQAKTSRTLDGLPSCTQYRLSLTARTALLLPGSFSPERTEGVSAH